MASSALPIDDRQARQGSPHLADELLEEIFLRLSTPTDLARASIACAAFRRIIADRSFLRRFRAIQPPPLLGFVRYGGFDAAQPPHPSAPLVRAVAEAADFSYSVVPTGKWSMPWYPRDIGQGRVLQECTPADFYYLDDVVLWDLELAVCDPLFRRYVLLPPITEELTAPHVSFVDFVVFVASTSDDDEETSFRVICTAWKEIRLFAFVFYSVTGEWSIAASPSWDSSGTVVPSCPHGLPCFDYAQSWCYWTMLWRDKLLVLDTLTMSFSIVNNMPSGNRALGHGQPCIVATADGTPELFFFGDQEDGSIDLLHFRNLNDSGGKWQLEKTIPLPPESIRMPP